MTVSTLMEHKGFKAQVMEAQRLTGDYVHELPPGSALPVYPVDMLLDPPEGWMKGPGVFVIPVKPNRGLWFNWMANSNNNTAIIPTVKGCNPITGMQTSGFHMERYENKCPKHGCNFIHDRFCTKCNYKWPPQNYIGPSNKLWLDGYLNQKDGTVRQFFFSEEELRDVASILIGKNNTVPAFGFAFYTPKELRPDYYDFNEDYSYNHFYNYIYKYNYEFYKYDPIIWNSMPSNTGTFKLNESSKPELYPIFETFSSNKPIYSSSEFNSFSNVKESYDRKKLTGSYIQGPEELFKEVSVGAGARIYQKLNQDPYELSSWKESPDSVMTIYFVFQEKFEEIKAKGIRNIEGTKEGFLTGVTVG